MSYRLAAVLIAATLAAMTIPSAPASHADGFYDGPVWFEWDRLQLQAVIFPPETGQLRNGNGVLNNLDPDELAPCTNSYTQALRDAMENWKAAVNANGAAWFKSAFSLQTHFVGCDPASEFPSSPDIVVITDATKGPVLGVAVSSDPCIINNSRISTNGQSFTYADMFNVMGHEFAHCLGLGHTGDLDGGAAGDPSHPDHDIVEGRYEHAVGANPAVHLHCVSNLNVRVLEAVFDANVNPTQIVTMSTGSYAKIATAWCNNAGEPVS